MLLSMAAIAQKEPVPNPVLTADSLASGNYKDVLNSFFQLSFDKLTGPDKAVRFSLNPFAVMARLDTTLLVDTSYIRYRTLRNLNFSFAAALDTSYRFNGFHSGVKFALINKRDETVSRTFVNTVLTNEAVKQLFALNDMAAILVSSAPNPAKATQFAADWDQFTTGKIGFHELDTAMQRLILTRVNNDPGASGLAQLLKEDPQLNIRMRADSLYNDIKDNFHKNLLWTIGLSDTTYKDEFMFSNVVFTSELLLGVNKFRERKNDLELRIKTDFQWADDSLKDGRDLKRMVFGFEPGINLVVKTKTTKKSWLEFMLSGSYYHTLNDLYPGEERDRLLFNGTLRVRILGDIWIPLEIKYDPDNGNVFGFLNVRANFKSLNGIAKSLF